MKNDPGLALPENLLSPLIRLKVNIETVTTNDCPEGSRKFMKIASGDFTGPSFSGSIVSGNNLRICRRPDEVGKVEYELLLKTERDQYLWMFGVGLFYAHDAIRNEIRRKKEYPGDPSLYYLRVTGRFESNSSDAVHLNRQLFLAIGEITNKTFTQNVFLIN